MNDLSLLPLNTIFKELNSGKEGLSTKEALKRLAKYGPNQLKEKDPTKWYHILLGQFANLMTLILGLATIISFAVGENLDGYAILAVVILNVIIGFLQEFKAEKAVKALKKLTAPYAMVLRDGIGQRIKANELVPGDIIILEEGMRVPADARLIESFGLKSLEGSLTGESQSVEKHVIELKKVSGIGDLTHTVFLGTVISHGHGLGIVIGTGMKTEFGLITKLLDLAPEEKTSLQKDITRLSKILIIIVLFITAFLFALAFIKGEKLLQMFMLSISLAVSVIPEGLATIITLTLAIGVQNLAGKNAIVRKLASAETLGLADVICTDKTGTLTQNMMTAQRIYINGKEIEIQGTGYDPSPSFTADSKELKLLLTAGALCNNASLIKEKSAWTIIGDPTEGALITLAQKGGFLKEELLEKMAKKSEMVFDSERKLMSTVNGNFLFTKGAPDSVIKVCNLSKKEKEELLKKNAEFAKKGYRVLALAYKELKKNGEPKEENLTFLGLTALSDPPRPEVKSAIELCRQAHIKVVMITGDHALTAQAIGLEIGLFKKGDRILTGEELEKMSQADLAKIVENISIYARVSPSHKVKILKALKQKGHTVAMTGDGVNDAPALKNADIGIAMGISGTDVSKEASDIILTDDNFATIVEAIKSGRAIYSNIKKFIRFLLSANFDEVIVVTCVFLIGGPIPFLPLQILWINLLTDSLPALALGMDNVEENLMTLHPKKHSSVWKEIIKLSLFVGVISSVMSMVVYLKTVNVYSAEHMRTIMFTTVVTFELLLVFSVRFANKNYFTGFFKNKFLLLAVALSFLIQILAIYTKPLQKILETVPLSFADWSLILSMSGATILILEIWKVYKNRNSLNAIQ